ncbi:MAG: DUF2190 family protein [Candidatus Kapabacteria bacterium]|nr:DUF2190 family protein [Candidatus Kapabacteria bacterium]
MTKNQITYQPVQAITVKAKEDLSAFRFVSHLGSLCAENAKSLGVTENDWLKDEFASVVTLGTIGIEMTTGINAGENITSAADGKGTKAGENSEINGRALDSISGAGFIRMILVP